MIDLLLAQKWQLQIQIQIYKLLPSIEMKNGNIFLTWITIGLFPFLI